MADYAAGQTLSLAPTKVMVDDHLTLPQMTARAGERPDSVMSCSLIAADALEALPTRQHTAA